MSNVKQKRMNSQNDCTQANQQVYFISQAINQIEPKKSIRQSGKASTYPCSYCSNVYTNSSKLRIHSKVHLPSKSLCCSFPKCQKTYNSMKGLNLHLKSHSGYTHYKCKQCEERFFCSRDQRYHFLKMHFVHKRSMHFKCQVCCLTFQTYRQLKAHRMQWSHKSKTKSYFQVRKQNTKLVINEANINHPTKIEVESKAPADKAEKELSQYFDFESTLSDVTDYKLSNNKFLLQDIGNFRLDNVLKLFQSSSL